VLVSKEPVYSDLDRPGTMKDEGIDYRDTPAFDLHQR